MVKAFSYKKLPIAKYSISINYTAIPSIKYHTYFTFHSPQILLDWFYQLYCRKNKLYLHPTIKT